jgi:ATP-binding cassette subfamily B protein
LAEHRSARARDRIGNDREKRGMSSRRPDARGWLAGYFRRQWRSLGAASLLMAARAGVLVLLPWPLKFIIDSVILGRPLAPALARIFPDPSLHRLVLLDALVAMLLVLGALDALLSYAGCRLLLDGAQRIAFDIRRDFFAHLQRLPLDFHRRHMSGELISRVSEDVRAMQDFIVSAGIDLLPHLLTIAAILAVMLAMNSRYGLMTLAVAPVLAIMAHRFAGRIRAATRRVRQREGRLWGATQEVLGNVQLVQSLAREDMEDRRFAERAGDALEAGMRANRIQAAFGPTMNLLIATATGMIVWYGAALVLRGRLTAGELLVFLAYLRGIATPARQLAKAGRIFGRAAVALERLDEYRTETSPVADRADAVTPPTCAGHVELRGVSFGYRASQPVVSDISFEMCRGETVALVGATGSGKSTLGALIARFYDPGLGQIVLDGRDIREIRLCWLRRQIALIPQEPQLFHAPIWQNIAYGREGAGRMDSIRAAEAAGVDEILGRLPNGYDTIASERGLTLSGGQRQCVAIARAMLSDASVVVLDEPSSSVDALTEQRLMQALRRLARSRAALLIAHRLETVVGADVILVLERGRIVQRGCHSQLVSQEGAYRQLWHACGSREAGGSLRLIAS